MLSLFGFGKRRRKSTKRSHRSKSHNKKPPARLLKICKKYRVKATKKVGKHRVYKSISVLKKACLKKALVLRKKLMKQAKKAGKRRVVHRRRSRRMFGAPGNYRPPIRSLRGNIAFGARSSRRSMFGSYNAQDVMRGAASGAASAMQFGMVPGMGHMPGMAEFGARGRKRCSRRNGFGLDVAAINAGTKQTGACMTLYGPTSRWSNGKCTGSKFGKRRASSKRVSKAAAMKAFKAFWGRHCKSRGSRFGRNGPLGMGIEFCPSGKGGVLGATGTGLFPTPCTGMDAAQAAAESALVLPSYTSFGKRRRRRTVRRRKPVRKVVRRRRRRARASGFANKAAANRYRAGTVRGYKP